MTKLFLLALVSFLGVACGGLTDRPTDRPTGSGLSKPDRSADPEQELTPLYVCPAGSLPNYLASALVWSVDSWAQTGALIAVSCDADGKLFVDLNRNRCGDEGGDVNACADADGIHINAERVPEEWAHLVLSHALGHLLGAEHTEQGVMRELWLDNAEATAFSSAFICPDESATSQIPGADYPCPLPEPEP